MWPVYVNWIALAQWVIDRIRKQAAAVQQRGFEHAKRADDLRAQSGAADREADEHLAAARRLRRMADKLTGAIK